MQATGDEQVRIGVGVFVFEPPADRDRNRNHSNRFIFGERIGSLGGGTLALPGGHLEFGETFEECAAREVLEETGLEVEGVEFLTSVNNLFRAGGAHEDGGGKVQRHYITIFMTAVAVAEKDCAGVVEPVNREKDKCKDWRWGTLDEMIEMGVRDGLELFLPLKNLVAMRPEDCEGLRKRNLKGIL